MKQEDDIGLKQESQTDSGCPICLESYESQAEIVLLLCCTTSTSLKALHSDCAQNIFNENSRCPFCRAEDELKFIILDNGIFKELTTLNKEELKKILDLGKSQSSEVVLEKIKLELAASQQQRDLYSFLQKNNLSSKEYFDDSPLPIKIKKLLDNGIKLDVMLIVIEKFLATGIDVNSVDEDACNALHFICRCWPKIPLEIIVTILDKLLAAKINVNATTNKGSTALHFICERWPKANIPPETMLTVINKLLQTGIDVNAVTDEGATALHFICCYWPKNNVPSEITFTVIDKLLQAKINVNIAMHGQTALDCVCRYWPAAKVTHESILIAIEKLLAGGAEKSQTALRILENFSDDDSKKLAQKVGLLITMQAASPEKRDFYSFLLSKNLISEEYSDDSPLPVKIEKLLNDTVPSDVILAFVEKFTATGMDVNVADKDGWNVLHYMCGYWPKAKIPDETRRAVIDKLLSAKIKVNAVTNKGSTALHLICYYWPEKGVPSETIVDAINTLLKANIDVNIATLDGRSVLHLICYHWPTKIPHETILSVIEKLLKAGANATSLNKEGKTALQILEISSDDNSKKLLKGIRSLLLAVQNLPAEQNGFYSFLLSQNLTSQEYFDDSPLPVKLKKLLDDKILFNVMLAVIEKFIATGMDLNATDKDGRNALHYVCRFWPENKVPSETILIIIKKLLETKINVSAVTNKGSTALDLICSWWPESKIPSEIMLTVIDKLLEANINVNATATHAGWTALHSVCGNWPKEKVPHEIILTVINKLLEAKINVNAAVNGWTALHMVCFYWPEAKVPAETILNAINKLLGAKADVNVANRDGWTALHLICRNWPEKKVPAEIMLTVIEKFFEANINVNAVTNKGATALHYICCYWPKSNIFPETILKTIDKLLIAKINVNAAVNGWTALHMICFYWPETNVTSEIILTIINKLLEAKVDVNATTEDDWTALHIICRYWLEANVSAEIILNVINKLLEANGNINAINKNSKKALSADTLIDFFNQNTQQSKLNIQVARKYLLQQMNANQTEAVTKVWNWVCEKPFRLQEFKTLLVDSADYYHPLAFARLHRYATKSFFKDNQEISVGYRKVVELLLIPKNVFFLSEEQRQILEEVSTFDKQLLPPSVLLGLKLIFKTNIFDGDIDRANEYFLQAAKAGWLLGYVLAAQQCERELDVAKNLEQAIVYHREIIFSSQVAANELNKKCFIFALESLHELTDKKKEIFALKVLGDYYLKLGKATKALDLFLQVKIKTEEIPQQELIVNEKLKSLITEIDLALGKLSHESGAVVKACHEYNYGPAYLNLAERHMQNKSGSQFFEAVECYCQAMITIYEPQAKAALEGLTIIVAAIQNDKKSCFKIIAALIEFIAQNKSKEVSALQIPLLLKLIQTLKLEKLFLEIVSPANTQDKLELFLHKFSPKKHFSTDCARAFVLLITENKSIEDICQIVIKDDKREKLTQFFQLILDNQSELPPFLVDKEIQQRAEQVLSNLKENLSALPALIQ